MQVLRLTGIRIEELAELSHHSFVQYRDPATGELVPLLQIAPSKTDTERLLVIAPELADVLSAVICRIRRADGTVPLVVAYDIHERVWNPPMPLLFQRQIGIEHRPIPIHGIRALLNAALAGTGLTDASGNPLTFTPHDFRRLFITEAVLNGMPPHIAQLVAGHADISATMGYKAVYPEEVINAHRAFIARRRATRPSEEYRVPTDEEWEQFLGHFERRKVALGDCGRAYGASCAHEHSCIRCPLLRVDPSSAGTAGRHLRQPDRPDRRSRTRRLGRRSRGPQDQPRRGAAEARPAGSAGPPRRHRAPRHARPGRYRRPHPHRAGTTRPTGAVMTPPAVTGTLLHDLVTRSHAEGITTLGVEAAIEHDDRVLLIVRARPGLHR